MKDDHETVAGGGLASAGAAPFSRRHLMGRFGKGAVAVGVVAWITPEILIATPTAAGAVSQCPDKDNDGDDCDPDKNGGGGDGGDNGGDGGDNGGNGGNNGDQNAPPQSSPSGGSNGGTGGSTGSGSSTGGAGVINSTSPAVDASGSSTNPAAPAFAASQGSSSGGSLPFTGGNLARDTELAGALIGGGWLLTRWAARRNRAAVEGEPGPEPDA
ncbi:MAG TPA: hypothetical protein VKU86_13540 [Acidimicrobiales bacterium]|nr:hypothetical protein [Acidimicrobiales bacterium]